MTETIVKVMRAPISILLALSFAGCGFYLKGERPLPPELSEVYVNYSSGYEAIRSRLEEALHNELTRRGARVIDSATANGRLNVYRLEEENRVLSVGPDGKAIEYELVTTAEFDYSVGGKLRVPRQQMSVLREYSFDETRVLAKQIEREQLQREMQEELAGLMLLRIDAGLANPPPDPAPDPIKPAPTAAPAN